MVWLSWQLAPAIGRSNTSMGIYITCLLWLVKCNENKLEGGACDKIYFHLFTYVCLLAPPAIIVGKQATGFGPLFTLAK